ncbi:MAG: hypothetical protein RL885_16800 [Planctomycetota bacterium]
MTYGLPDGPIRRQPPIDLVPSGAREALREIMECDLKAQRRELLLAWLSAYEHHWPTSFRFVFGDEGPAALEALQRQAHDANRYLKLRRIAIENLTRIHLPEPARTE